MMCMCVKCMKCECPYVDFINCKIIQVCEKKFHVLIIRETLSTFLRFELSFVMWNSFRMFYLYEINLRCHCMLSGALMCFSCILDSLEPWVSCVGQLCI